MASSRVEIFYSGRVQGVGFRMTTRHIARRFLVFGAVRNLEDGRVQLIAEGERAELDRFLAELEIYFRGNIAERLSRWGEGRNEFSSFDIVV